MTDMHFRDIDLPGTTRGLTSCTSMHSGMFSAFCDRNDVQIDAGYIISRANELGHSPAHNLRKTICHEAGHAMGLTHYKTDVNPDPPNGESDCMIRGSVSGTSSVWIVLANHHKSHLNDWYV